MQSFHNLPSISLNSTDSYAILHNLPTISLVSTRQKVGCSGLLSPRVDRFSWWWPTSFGVLRVENMLVFEAAISIYLQPFM